MSLLQVVDVTRSIANMLPTKLEVKLRKAEPGSWLKLDIPHQTAGEEKAQPPPTVTEQFVPEADAVDLSDL
jgi:cysteine/histidine-rich domain-containing protein